MIKPHAGYGVNGEETTFTSRNMNLLTFWQRIRTEYLQGRTVPEIWDMESVGDIATVAVHIKKIREKKISSIQPSHSILRQSGVLDVVSKSEYFNRIR